MKPDHDPIDFAAHEREQANEAKRAAVVARDAEEDWRWLMDSKRGRRMVWRLLDDSGTFRDPFHLNAAQMARNTGERAWGLKVSMFLQVRCPDLWILMFQENEQQ